MKFKLVFVFNILVFYVFSQSQVVGNIYDANSEKPIKSAFVVHLGKNAKPILTDKYGKFKVSGLDQNDTLMFTAKGYIPTMIAVGTAKKMKVLLSPQIEENNYEIGYGSQNSKSLTSSVFVLESKDFNNVLAPDIYSYLRSKIPGLHVEAYGPNPAIAPKILLRASGSFSNIYEPLIVIDGVQNASITNLDPNDVKSLTVLKDASAQAIYGSQANGGVIIIKTKGGKG